MNYDRIKKLEYRIERKREKLRKEKDSKKKKILVYRIDIDQLYLKIERLK